MNKDLMPKIRRLGIIALGVFTAVYMCYRVYVACVDKVQTQAAVVTEQNDSLTVQGFILRSEEYVNVEKGKTVVSLAQDGSKVTAGNPIAMTFASEAQAADYELLTDVRSEIERYEKLAAVSPVSNIDTKGLDSSIDRAVISLVDDIENDRLDQTEDAFSLLRSAVIKRQLIVGETVSFDSILSALRVQETSLVQSVAKSGTVKAKNAGYFVGSTDGYENLVDYSMVESILPEEVDQLFAMKPQAVEKNCIGRLVTQFNWYIVSKVDLKSIEKLKKGAKVRIAFPNTSAEEIDGMVAALNVDGAGSAAVVLRCNRMDGTLLKMRREEVEIIFNTVSGFRVPTEAVREENGKKGVYILRANTVSFREINILWASEDYIITGGEGNQVKRYDQIITKGKNLYDGKAVA
ncbi:MAG: hypothetical protein IJU96_06050 [Clostridia bacterium]|nr:hypothetical protein [Clostridia bacterium]